jgi:hypothetical protein
LAKEGKLNPSPGAADEPTPPPDNVAGGSAATAISDRAEKDIAEMTVDEKREALMEIERQGGSLLPKT